jgi:hypothetical protein
MHSRQALWIGLALLTASCSKEEVRVYEVAKENQNPTPASAPTPTQTSEGPTTTPASAERPPTPKVPWTVPPEWQERPNSGGMRLASYGVTAPDGRSVDISVVALGDQAGTELENVNRWRGQLKLSDITADQLDSARDPVLIGRERSHLYDIVSSDPVVDGKYKARILAAILPAGGMTVFFKATGEAELVAAEKLRFIGWLRSVKTGPDDSEPASTAPSTTATATPPPAATTAANGLPSWTAPAHWKVGGPRPMRLASFEVPGDGATADISISALGAAGGGLLANVNRWRGQIGLGPVDEATLSPTLKPLQLAGGSKATLIEIAGPQTNILGAIIPTGERTWFLKMTGPGALVTRERENFTRWVQSVGL